MTANYQWAQSKARLKLVRANLRANYNWLFLPGDGSNTTNNNAESFSHWRQGLIELVNALPNNILVAHSTGGMFALATPELQNNLRGLVLTNSAANASWQTQFAAYASSHPLIQVESL